MKYSDFTIGNLPEGKYIIVWYGNINQFKNSSQDYFITYIIRNIYTGEVKVIYRNVKEAPAISLGSIINNKKITGATIGEEFTRLINVPQHNDFTVIKTQNKSFYENEKYFSFSNNNIMLDTKKSYKLLDRSREQTLLEYRDEDGVKILFPSYVIAQYYYFRTASMVRQVMASNLAKHTAIEGLYKDISIDVDGNGRIVLTNNAKGTDGADIFRFVMSEYANKMFHRVQHDLVKSSQKIKDIYKGIGIESSYNTGVLNAFFPFSGAMIIRFRGIRLSDGSILAQQIISEDSNYPFETLTILREHKEFNDKLVQLGRVHNKLQAKIKKFFSQKSPNSSFESVAVKSEVREDGRLGLRDKDIMYGTLNVDEKVENSTIVENVDHEVEVNSREAEYSGDMETTHAYIETGAIVNPDEWEEKERPGLESFIYMLQKAQEEDSSFEYNVDDQLMLPQKPISDESRKKWLKALMSDNITPRAYACAHIEYNEKHICVIDIERDSRVEGLSVLIIAMNNNTPISETLINRILVDFVKESGSWLKDITADIFKYTTIKHPIDITDELIEKWAKRLLKAIKLL